MSSSKGKRTPGVKWLEDKQRWQVRVVRIDPRTKKEVPKKKLLPLGASYAEAVVLQEKLVQLIETGGRPTTEGWTVSAYARSWLMRRLPRLKSQNSREKYTEHLENHILPDFGDWLIEAVDQIAIDEWLVKPRNRHALHAALPGRKPRAPAPYSPETVNSWLNVFKMMLQDAVNELALPRDPTLRIRPLPDRDQIDEETNTLTAEEVVRFFVACKKKYPQWFAFIVLGFSVGCRPGELRPLRWLKDLNPTTGVLTLRQSQSRKQHGPTKTKTPRDLPLPPELVAVLHEHRAWLKRNGHPAADGPLIFPPSGRHWRVRTRADITPRKAADNTFWSNSALDKPFQEIAALAGIDRHITPKTFRRTFNDIARKNAGLNNVITRSLTGHQSIEMQELYSTVDIAEKRVGLAKVIGLFQLTQGQVQGQVGGPFGALPDSTRHRKEGTSD